MNESEPVLSVVMPVYNRDWCVAAAVQSVLAICQPSLELIIVDDGSTDKTPAIVDDLARRHTDILRVKRHPGGGNRGIAASRNLGIRESRGQYVAFLDSDDFYYPHRFDFALPWLDTHSGMLAAIEPYDVVDLRSDAPPCFITHLTGYGSALERGENPLPRAMLCSSNYWRMPVITVRREAFAQFGGCDERLRFGEETSLWLKLAAAGVVGVAQSHTAVARVQRHGDHSWDPADIVADLLTHLAVLLEAYRWVRGNSVSLGVRELFEARLPAYLVELLTHGALARSVKLQSWWQVVEVCPVVLLQRRVNANLVRALLRFPRRHRI